MNTLNILCILLVFILSSCGEPEDKTEPLKTLSGNEKKQVLKKYRANAVLGETDLFYSLQNHKKNDCRLCHEKAILSHDDGKQSHWNIELKHSQTMDCQSCHDEEKPQELLFGKKRIALKNSYQLCSTCHFEQAEDWKGGAHGKRLSGWKEPRVIMNCVSCHNPHDPKFKHDSTVAHPEIIPQRLKHLKKGNKSHE